MNDFVTKEISGQTRARAEISHQFADTIKVVDLRDLFRTFWRRKGLIVGTMLFLMVLATIILFQLTPLYTGQTYILIQPRDSNVVDLEAVLAGLGSDKETIQSEIEVIRSRQLIGKLVDKLRFERNPEFNATLRPKGVYVDNVKPYINPTAYNTEVCLSSFLGKRLKDVISEDSRRNP